jgi:ADP-ribose pyrophosphatase YjhB (NUDIX family)
MELEALQVKVYRNLPGWLQQQAIRRTTPNFTVGSLAWLTDDGDRVLLSRSSYRAGWLPTGGFVRRGETPFQTLEREVTEELGTVADLRPHHRVAFDVRKQGVSFVHVGLLKPGVALVLSPEVLETQWFSLDHLPDFPPTFHERWLPEDAAALRALG